MPEDLFFHPKPHRPEILIQKDIQTQARWGVITGARAIELGYQMLALSEQGTFSWTDLQKSSLSKQQLLHYTGAMLNAHLKAGVLMLPWIKRHDKKVKEVVKQHGLEQDKDERDPNRGVQFSKEHRIEDNVKGVERGLLSATAQLLQTLQTNTLVTTPIPTEQAAQQIQKVVDAAKTGNVSPEFQILQAIFTTGHNTLYPSPLNPLKPTDLEENPSLTTRFDNPLNTKVGELLKANMKINLGSNLQNSILPQAIDQFIKALMYDYTGPIASRSLSA